MTSWSRKNRSVSRRRHDRVRRGCAPVYACAWGHKATATTASGGMMPIWLNSEDETTEPTLQSPQQTVIRPQPQIPRFAAMSFVQFPLHPMPQTLQTHFPRHLVRKTLLLPGQRPPHGHPAPEVNLPSHEKETETTDEGNYQKWRRLLFENAQDFKLSEKEIRYVMGKIRMRATHNAHHTNGWEGPPSPWRGCVRIVIVLKQRHIPKYSATWRDTLHFKRVMPVKRKKEFLPTGVLCQIPKKIQIYISVV